MKKSESVNVGGTRQRRVASVLLMLTLLMAVIPGFRNAMAQTVDPDGHAEVIAQGVGTLPSGQVVWRVTDGTAPVAKDSVKATYPLGFVFLPEGKAQIDNSGTGNRVLLQDAEASFQQAGTEQRRKGTETKSADYLGLELVAAADVNNVAANNELKTQSDAFAAPSSDRDVNLVRDVLEADENGVLPGSDIPTYVYATDGSIDVETTDGNSTTLAAGEGALFTGDLKITGGSEDGGKYLAAVIGDQVAKAEGGNGNGNGGKATPVVPNATPSANNGGLRVTVFSCTADPSAGDVSSCTPGVAGPNAVVQDTATMTKAYLVLSAPKKDGATYVWGAGDIDVDSYDLHAFDDGSGTQLTYATVSYTGGTPSGNGDLDVIAGQTTSVDYYIYTPGAEGYGGLRVTVYSCTADPSMGDTSSCTADNAGPNAVVQDTATMTNAYLVQSAPMRDGATYVWGTGDVVADAYDLHAFDDGSGTQLVYVTVSTPSSTGTFDVLPGATTSVDVFIYTPTGDATPEV